MILVSLVLTALLSAIFVAAAASKLANPRVGRETAATLGVPLAFAPTAGATLPVVECAVGVGLLAGPTMGAAAGAGFCGLALFTLAMTRVSRRTEPPLCHGFGETRTKVVGPAGLARNLALMLACAALLAIEPTDGLWETIGLPRLGFWESALLASLPGVVVMLVAQGKTRPARVKRVPSRMISVAPAALGLALGDRAPTLVARDREGQAVSLIASRPLILVFTNARMPGAAHIAETIAAWRAAQVGILDFVILFDGDPADCDDPTALFPGDRAVLDRLGVWGAPEAILILPDGRIGSNLAKGLMAVRALVEAAPTQPVPPASAVTAGDLNERKVKAVKGVDREGRPRSSAEFLSGPTVVLHWSSDCEFCRSMIPALEAWDRAPPPWAPRLLVLSTTPPARDFALELRSPVLSDVKISDLAQFGVDSTPSAVLVDAGGLIASQAVVGVVDVLAMINGVRARDAVHALLPSRHAPQGWELFSYVYKRAPFARRVAREDEMATARDFVERMVLTGCSAPERAVMLAWERLVWPYKAARLTLELDRTLLRAAAEAARRSIVSHAIATAFDCAKFGLAPEDYTIFALWRPERRADASAFVSRDAANWIYFRLLARVEAEPLSRLADKARFAAFCFENGIATPRILAVAVNGAPQGVVDESDPAWRGDVIVKPRDGSGGAHVELWRFADGGFVTPDGRRHAREAILDDMCRSSATHALIAQPRIVNDTATVRYTSGALATFRIVTGAKPDGSVHLIAAALKMPSGDSVADNFAVGNVLAQVDIRSGRLMSGQAFARRFTDIDAHPDTGARFAGEPAPGIFEVVELCLRFHRLSVSVPLLSFDAASTPEGPVIIEANNRGHLDFIQFHGAPPLMRTPFAEFAKNWLGGNVSR